MLREQAMSFYKTSQQDRAETHQSSYLSVNVKRMQTACHHIHERPGNDDISVCVFQVGACFCVCMLSVEVV